MCGNVDIVQKPPPGMTEQAMIGEFSREAPHQTASSLPDSARWDMRFRTSCRGSVFLFGFHSPVAESLNKTTARQFWLQSAPRIRAAADHSPLCRPAAELANAIVVARANGAEVKCPTIAHTASGLDAIGRARIVVCQSFETEHQCFPCKAS